MRTSKTTFFPLLIVLASLLTLVAGLAAFTPAAPVSAASAAPAAPAASTPSVPTLDHVVWLVEENHDYSGAYGLVGSSKAPYLNNTLIPQGALATNYIAETHPSLPNYLALIGGSTYGVTQDCTATGAKNGPCKFSTGANNLFHEVDSAGKVWKQYAESESVSCDPSNERPNTTTPYYVRHAPPPYFTDLSNCASRDASSNFANLGSDFSATSAANTPAFSFVTPNGCHDMHDGTKYCGGANKITNGDNWLKTYVPKILNSYAFTHQHSLLAITVDEDSDDTGGDGNKVMTLFLGYGVAPGSKDTTSYPHGHYSLLHTTEAALGLGTLTANDAGAPLMANMFQANVGGQVAPSISSFSPTQGVVGDSVTISGAGFTGATSVTFNGTAATFTVTNDTTIATSVPTGAATGPISVAGPGGSDTSATSFTVESAPPPPPPPGGNSAEDDFNRANTSAGLGASTNSDGQPTFSYLGDGASSPNAVVLNHQAQFTYPGSTGNVVTAFPNVAAENGGDLLTWFNFANSGHAVAGLFLNATSDENNWYKASFDIHNNQITLVKKTSGAAAAEARAAYTFSTGVNYDARMHFDPSSGLLEARVWVDGQAEPSTWNVSWTDAGAKLAAGLPGLGANWPSALSGDAINFHDFGYAASGSAVRPDQGVAAPVANFSADPTSGAAPLAVQFTDTSTGAPTAWSWDFGDGGSATSENPSHTYQQPGTYDVSLTASNAGGSDTDTETGLIVVNPACTPGQGLVVSGADLVDTCGASAVVLRGFSQGPTPLNTINGWRNGSRPSADKLSPNTLGAMANWGANVVRIPVSAYYADSSYMSELDADVAAARSAGLYVILVPFDDAKSGSPYTPAGIVHSEDVSFLQTLAAQYKSDTGVLFDVLNEPQYTSEATFLTDFSNAIQAIRAAGNTSPIVVESPAGLTGAKCFRADGFNVQQQQAWDANEVSTLLGVDPNLVFSDHRYHSVVNGDDTSESCILGAAKDHAYFIGEWGALPHADTAYLCQNLTSANADAAVNNFLDWSATGDDGHAVSWTAWNFEQTNAIQDAYTTYTPTVMNTGSWACDDGSAADSAAGQGSDVKAWLASN